MACEIFFYSEFPDIREKSLRRRWRKPANTKAFASQANAKNFSPYFMANWDISSLFISCKKKTFLVNSFSTMFLFFLLFSTRNERKKFAFNLF